MQTLHGFHSLLPSMEKKAFLYAEGGYLIPTLPYAISVTEASRLVRGGGRANPPPGNHGPPYMPPVYSNSNMCVIFPPHRGGRGCSGPRAALRQND